ncbi:MAG: glutathione S-transferase family protein [Hyphomicrobiaceae bacterium]
MRRLLHYPLCPHSRSIRLAMSELQLDFELAHEEPWTWQPSFLSLNPSGALPVLEMERAVVLCGAYAISEYLADIYATHPTSGDPSALFPGDSEQRAEVRRLVDWFHCKMDQEVTRELLMEKHYQRAVGKVGRPPDSTILRAVAKNMRYHLEYISFLVDHRNWLAGDDLSFADLAAGGHVSVADYMGEVPWEDFKSARDWYARLKSRGSFQPLLDDYLSKQPPASHYADLDF